MTQPAGGSVRYGVIVRPDAATGHAVSQLHRTLGVRFGLRAAAIFPPSLVLVRNIATGAPVIELRDRIGAALPDVPRTVLTNHGPTLKADGALVCPVSDGPGRPGSLQTVTDMVQRLRQAIEPVRRSAATDYLQDHADFAGFVPEILVASQDLVEQPELRPAVEQFLADSAVVVPAELPVNYVSLYRFELADWTRPWWPGLTWQMVWSWPLADPEARGSIRSGAASDGTRRFPGSS